MALAAHKAWNLNFQPADKTHVIFHNLRGYDCHFIMQHRTSNANAIGEKDNTDTMATVRKIEFLQDD